MSLSPFTPIAMDPQRRYSEEEVAEILDRATEAQLTRAPGDGSAGGLTLHELKEIGREVGIPEDVITRAATELDKPRPTATGDKRFLGQTIGVGRTVDLPRPLTEHEWNRLVVDLRETFDARGKMSSQGAFRQWNNSRLQALLEPTESGERLRLRTLKGNARTFQTMGVAFLGGGLVSSVLAAVGAASDPGDAVKLAVIGAAFFLGSRITVPWWARTRTRQFDEIIDRLTRSLPATPADPASLPSSRSLGDEDA